MKKLLYIMILIISGHVSADVLPDEIEIRGLAKDTPIKEFVEYINKKSPDARLTDTEVFFAIENELASLPLNSDQDYVSKIKSMLKNKFIVKGSNIVCYNSKNIFLIVGLDLQPRDIVPEPNSRNFLYKIPIRVSYVGGRHVRVIGEDNK